jgi:RNA polymerase sigma-70 factor (ECF subfamily)
MMTRAVNDSVSVEHLLSHARWVEGFARALVRDDAEDVAQDAWIAAIQKPPAAAASPRPWLATVMRNVARMRFRSSARREARESEIIADAPPTPAELTARMELQRRLASAVLALDEAQRSIVVLVFYEGMTPADAARRLDIPATTLRSRLRVALETMRKHLDAEEGGDRSRWKLALAPLVMMPHTHMPVIAIALALIAVMTTAGVIYAVLPHDKPVLSTPTKPVAITTPATTPAPQLALIGDAAAKPELPGSSGSMITPAFLRAEKTLLEKIDECYELGKPRNVRGVVKMTVEITTQPELATDISLDDKQTTIRDPETLECLRENAKAMESHIAELREAGEAIEGPIRVNVTRSMPPSEGNETSTWEHDDASPPCPTGTHLVSKDNQQWCELPDGTKHGPEWTWDAKGRLIIKSSYDHGQHGNEVQMRDPDD